jgi:L-cysteine:1D-myo-inositol 2-amino-2-deoxy-alpha-D-glucopyranoside ligase
MRSWLRPEVPALPGEARPLRLYDTASDETSPTAPGQTARIYVCGITPYDATHLGHAATYLAFDLVQRMWLDAGHEVQYVQNITDIDDPLLERAAATGVEWTDLAEREIELYRQDMASMRVLPPTAYVGAIPTGRASGTGSMRCCGAANGPASRPGRRCWGPVGPAGTSSAR